MDIELNESVCLRIQRYERRNFVSIRLIHIFYLAQPFIEYPVSMTRERGFDPAASIVTTDDYMFHFEVLDGE